MEYGPDDKEKEEMEPEVKEIPAPAATPPVAAPCFRASTGPRTSGSTAGNKGNRQAGEADQESAGQERREESCPEESSQEGSGQESCAQESSQECPSEEGCEEGYAQEGQFRFAESQRIYEGGQVVSEDSDTTDTTGGPE